MDVPDCPCPTPVSLHVGRAGQFTAGTSLRLGLEVFGGSPAHPSAWVGGPGAQVWPPGASSCIGPPTGSRGRGVCIANPTWHAAQQHAEARSGELRELNCSGEQTRMFRLVSSSNSTARDLPFR